MKELFYFVLCMLVVSCGKKESYDSTTYSIDPNQTETIHMSEFIDSVKYVKLELTQASRISKISEIFVDGDNLIIRSNNIIYIFSDKGEFLASINKKGRGNGEYLEIDAMTIDAKNDLIMVCCNMQRVLLYYSYDGKFVKKVDNFGSKRPYIRDIKYLADGNFLCADYMHSADALYKLWVLNAQGDLVEDVMVGEYTFPVSTPNFTLFEMGDDGIGFMDISSETDYIYKKGKLSQMTSYNVEGIVASDFKNVDINKFSAEYWKQGKSFNSRACTQYKGDYIITQWSNENRKIFYTLVDRSKGSVKTANKIDGELANSQIVLPSIQRTGAYIFRNNNLDGVLTTEVVAYEIDEQKTLNLLGINADDAYTMNPLIQFIYVKR